MIQRGSTAVRWCRLLEAEVLVCCLAIWGEYLLRNNQPTPNEISKGKGKSNPATFVAALVGADVAVGERAVQSCRLVMIDDHFSLLRHLFPLTSTIFVTVLLQHTTHGSPYQTHCTLLKVHNSTTHSTVLDGRKICDSPHANGLSQL